MIEWLPILFAATIGSLLGSFYTALAYRILWYHYGPARKEPDAVRQLFMRRSFCMSCKEAIPSLYLTPILGYLLLRGRCYNCRSRIGPTTFAGELSLTLLLPLLLYSGLPWITALSLTLFSGHLYLTMATDFRHRMADYENSIYLWLWAAVAALGSGGLERLISQSTLALAATLLFALLFVIGRGRALGFGDIPVAGGVAFALSMPWPIFVLMLASAASIVDIIRQRHSAGLTKRGRRRVDAPLAGYLAIAAVAMIALDAVVAIVRS